MPSIAREPRSGRPSPFDPLGASRRPGDPEFDVFVSGTVFFDIVFVGLEEPPRTGTEVWASGMGSGPGGAANMAIACSRLGMRTSLAATFGEDLYGDYCRQTLGVQEGVDLTYSRYVTGWHSPVTVSTVYHRDRTMVTHGHESEVQSRLVHETPDARATFVDIRQERQSWVDEIAAAGGLIFADGGWDPEERWDLGRLRAGLEGVHAFSPNAVEAMCYTRTSTPEAAVEALAELVPLAVVTCGAEGVLAHDRTSGGLVRVPGLPVEAIDPTGAGDVFLAGLLTGTAAGWDVERTLLLANLAAALSVRHFGGALASPGWGDIATWWRETGVRDPALAEHYAFLDEVLPDEDLPEVSRAIATLGFRAGRTGL